MVSEPGLIRFPGREAMAERLADLIEAGLGRAIAERGRAFLAVSGGSTPAGLYRALSRRVLDWTRVTAALVDERWVPPGSYGSNETFVHETLAQNEAGELRVIGLWSEAPTPAAGLAAAEARLAAIEGPFDVVLLGMGEDGHAASWFPHADGLGAALCETGPRLAAVTAKQSAATGEHIARLTMTLGAIRDARFICLLIAGEAKRATFEKALSGGPIEEAPVRAILRKRPDMWVCWTP